jgi:hypothetical protein
MRATEFIRSILDLIDTVDSVDCADSSCGCEDRDNRKQSVMVASNNDDEMRRFKQILGLTDNEQEQYANSPDERITDVDSVTSAAGGGVNGPKHPADIRGEHGRLHGGN